MARSLTRSAITPPTRRHLMGILLVILLVTLGLAMRAAAVQRQTSLSGSETIDDPGLVDCFARTSLLVLFCLVALFALGLMYGSAPGVSAGR
jgi:hypothetical protein